MDQFDSSIHIKFKGETLKKISEKFSLEGKSDLNSLAEPLSKEINLNHIDAAFELFKNLLKQNKKEVAKFLIINNWSHLQLIFKIL